jgi:hypothetical protein
MEIFGAKLNETGKGLSAKGMMTHFYFDCKLQMIVVCFNHIWASSSFACLYKFATNGSCVRMIASAAAVSENSN